ncbi:VOC family protein [Stenotrophomonas sp. WHRI 8082]|uniref:VOC family protein n=1 Tax=unclassified Stenotrophomonas TaxID=196198 RepID=UPI00177DB14A|nr:MULTISPECIES: VOC family protein [unclassified Stenotrophomonas]MBD8636793.1 VOC family protein [Stenotrophomonas sp. CFBP 13725]MBD8696298.1 VOC family protein [Stenotrophomonas sp. CFBP 13718]
MHHDNRIDYVEFASHDPASSRRFFETVFGWTFQDYGPDYTAFDDGRLQGGFFSGEPGGSSTGAPLLVLYADDLQPVMDAVVAAGGHILKPVFSFPGGSRFQFREPGGNELAVWSERDPAT